MYWRFARDLRRFFGDPLTRDECDRIIRQRLENRAKNLLAIVKGAVYENEKSPYLKLLRASGCEYGDFERMVTTNGIENALEELREAGVYVTIEEFKGKKECERHGKTYYFTERDFDNSIVSGHVPISSSGSRSKGTRSLYDLDFLDSNLAVYNLPILQGLNASRLPIAMWMPTIPGAGLINLLAYTKGGSTPARWFSPIDSQSPRASPKSRLAHSYILTMGRLAGVRWPSPEYVAYDDAVRVAEWIADTIGSAGGCVLDTYVSAILRVCRAAKETGIDIGGARFIAGGEPLTETKLKEIESAGAHVCIVYGVSEAGFVGASCFNPSHTDDMHLFEDSFALIQHKRALLHVDMDVNAFLLTSLDPSAPKVLLNMETGDCGLVETRSCDCVFGSCGLHRHIHNVRGFDRLTSEGMSFLGTDLVRIIEEVLPRHFGGSPTDYQMVEEEDEHSTTRLYIIVSPELGDIDEESLVQTALAELATGTDGMKLGVKVWSEAKTLRVRRTRPITTVTGKLLPLHIQKTG
jgi:hypothetical protein